MDTNSKAFQMLVVCMEMLVALDTLSSDMNQMFMQWTQTAFFAVQMLANKRKKTARSRWAYDRPQGFVDTFLLSSYSDNMFKARVRVSKDTFHFLCTSLAPHMARVDTNMRKAIPIETRVACALSRLATGNFYSMVGDLHGMGISTCQRILIDFCDAVRAVLHDKCVKWPDDNQKLKLAQEFQAIRGIPDVIGAVDGSHIPVLAPLKNREDFVNRKGYNSILLQCIVSAQCLIWDYDVGWAGSLHDWDLFNRSAAGKRCVSGDLGKYALIGDTAYQPRAWMLVPYKGTKEGLSRMKYHWNYVQSSTRMPVERAFGMLKSRFRVLTKRMDMNLGNICKVVSTCLVLHNLCILHGDHFDENWFVETQEELSSLENVSSTSSMRDINNSRAAADVLESFRLLHSHKKGSSAMQTDNNDAAESMEDNEAPDSMKENGVDAERGEQKRETLAKVLYSSNRKRPFQELMKDSSSTESSCRD